jgi:hypothetical protein
LRKHPKMTWKGSPSWPSQWGGATGPGARTRLAVGEVGILKSVERVPASSGLPAQLDLEIEYDQGIHTGAILVDDPDFLDLIYQTLEGCIGQSISEIGSLDLG